MKPEILKTLGVEASSVEVNLIAWLLNPREWHRWRNVLLMRFVRDIANTEFNGIDGKRLPLTGWGKAKLDREVSAGPGTIQILIQHPKGTKIGISTGEPVGLHPKQYHDYRRTLVRKFRPLVMMYLKPWYELEEYTKPPYSDRTSRMPLVGENEISYASCGRLYLSWVLGRGHLEVARLGKRVHPAALSLVQEFAALLHEQAERERHEDHRQR